jgi:hypothetical protein
MKILAAMLIVLLLAFVGGAAYFFLYMYQPILTELQTGKSDVIKATAELKKYTEREKSESAWINPMINEINTVLSDEIKTGKAEVVAIDNRVVINIAEQSLYMPGSKTFTNDSPPLRAKLDSLLRSASLKNKNIYIGNTTQETSAQTMGRKKIPTKDARTLAAERSMELVKYLEKKSVNQDLLIAAAYSSKQPEAGFKIKERKTMIVIETPLVVPTAVSKQNATSGVQSKQTPSTTPATITSVTPTAPAVPQAQSKQTPAVKPTSSATPTASPSSVQPKPIPIRAQPKTN